MSPLCPPRRVWAPGPRPPGESSFPWAWWRQPRTQIHTSTRVGLELNRLFGWGQELAAKCESEKEISKRPNETKPPTECKTNKHTQKIPKQLQIKVPAGSHSHASARTREPSLIEPRQIHQLVQGCHLLCRVTVTFLCRKRARCMGLCPHREAPTLKDRARFCLSCGTVGE